MEPDDTEPIARRLSWYETMLGKVSHKPMPEKKDSAVPKHLQMTKQVIDFGKYALGLVVGIAALGWMGHEYISQFQTETEATSAQEVNDTAHTSLQEAIEANGEAIDHIRVYNVRIELEQHNTHDGIEQLLVLGQAETRQERREAQREVVEIQERIDRRSRVIRNPAALKRVADQVRDDPLGGLNGHLL